MEPISTGSSIRKLHDDPITTATSQSLLKNVAIKPIAESIIHPISNAKSDEITTVTTTTINVNVCTTTKKPATPIGAKTLAIVHLILASTSLKSVKVPAANDGDAVCVAKTSGPTIHPCHYSCCTTKAVSAKISLASR